MTSADSSIWKLLEGVVIEGKYRLHRLIGVGASGGAFDAELLALNSQLQHVAIKLIEPAAGRESQQLAEIAALAGLSHPALLRTFTPGISTLNGIRLLYMPSEFADDTLRGRLSASRLSLDEVRDVGIAVASALVYLHEQQRPLVHRDVKPANTMRLGARWKLGDFGLLRSVSSRSGVRTRNFAGTAEYAPPESYDGLISPAWDIWSLGVMLHEATAGRSPFAAAESPQQLMHAVCSEDPEIDPDLPVEFRDLVLACIDKDPTVRLTAERVLEALETLDTAPPPAAVHVRRKETPETAHGPIAHAAAPVGPMLAQVVVDASGDGDCKTIAEALLRAESGGTILIKPGRYREPLTIESPVELIGDGPLADIVIVTIGIEALVIAAPNAVVRGLTITGRPDMNRPKHNGIVVRIGPAIIQDCDISCSSGAAAAVHADARDVVFRSCAIHNGKTAGVVIEGGATRIESCSFTANFGPAVHIKSSGDHEIASCDIYDGREAGIVADRGARIAVTSSSVYNNEGAGILLQESSAAQITGCAVYGNKHAGISARAKSTVEMTDCDITANMLSGAAFSGSNAHLVRCKLHDGRSNGLVVSDVAHCTLEQVEISANGFAGIKVSHGAKLNVTKSHLHSGKRNAAVIQDEGEVVFTDCDFDGNGQAAVQVEEGGRADVIECRFTACAEGCVTFAGAGTMQRCTITGSGKSAIESIHGGNPTITDCTLDNNKMPAILVHGKSEAVIERCRVSNNEMPGIGVGEAAKALISECVVASGAQVGMVFWDRAKGIVDRCEVIGCKMDGIRIMQGSEPVISGCKIRDNGAYGIHVSGESGGEVVDCDITSNGLGPAYIEAGSTTASSGNIV